MRDKLTKKRVKKADYLLIVELQGLSADFERFLVTHYHHIKSLQRKALYFLKSRGLNDVILSDIYAGYVKQGYRCYDDWLKETIRICKTPWLDDDD